MSIDHQIYKTGERFKQICRWLQEGRKITTAGERKLRYKEDWNDPDSGTSTSNKTRYTDVVYFWANPQMNRIIARLADGRERDIKLGLMDIMWIEFMEYIEEEPPVSWRDVFDSQKIFPMEWRKCLRTAQELNYQYIAWNGKIFSCRDQLATFPLCTEEDLK